MDSKSNEGEFVHYFIIEGLQKIEDKEANDCVRVHNSQSIRDPRRTNSTQRDRTITEASNKLAENRLGLIHKEGHADPPPSEMTPSFFYCKWCAMF